MEPWLSIAYFLGYTGSVQMMVRYIVRNSHAMSFENARLKMNGQIIPLRCFTLDEFIGKLIFLFWISLRRCPP